jgi:hypothetical protein
MDWKKFFLFVGIPIIAFYTFLIVILFAFISGLFLWVLIVGCSSLYFKKKEIWKSLSKLSLALLFIIFLFYPNPAVWPSQIANHMDTSRIITPNHESVQQVYTEMVDHINQSCGLTYFYVNMTEHERLTNMTDYLTNYTIQYKEVMQQYLVLDYAVTAPDAIEEGWGDCKARTVVMVSVFLYMGYDAWGVEDCFHTYTCVFLGENKTDPHYYYRRGRTDYMIMFNNETVTFTKNLFQRLGYIFFTSKFSKEIREMFQEPSTLFILPAIFIGLGFLLPKIVGSDDEEVIEKKYLKNVLLTSIILNGGFALALGIGVIVPQVIMLIIMLSVILAVHIIHANLGARLFTKK